jgi:hypothetical protein
VRGSSVLYYEICSKLVVVISELDTARELSQVHQNESQTQASQAAAVLTLNMKLQSTATKNQAKTIDLEIKRLDAAQAREMLSIVQVRLIIYLHISSCSSTIPSLAIPAPSVH